MLNSVTDQGQRCFRFVGRGSAERISLRNITSNIIHMYKLLALIAAGMFSLCGLRPSRMLQILVVSGPINTVEMIFSYSLYSIETNRALEHRSLIGDVGVHPKGIPSIY